MALYNLIEKKRKEKRKKIVKAAVLSTVVGGGIVNDHCDKQNTTLIGNLKIGGSDQR